MIKWEFTSISYRTNYINGASAQVDGYVATAKRKSSNKTTFRQKELHLLTSVVGQCVSLFGEPNLERFPSLVNQPWFYELRHITSKCLTVGVNERLTENDVRPRDEYSLEISMNEDLATQFKLIVVS